MRGNAIFRVAVIGCGGAGKTVLARRLSARLGLPLTHLDDLYYGDPPVPFETAQRAVVDGDRWIIDGNYASTLPMRLARADTVIFLDLPAWVCLWGIAARRRRGEPNRINWPFLRYVAGYRRHMRPRVLSLVRTHAPHARFLHLTTRRQATAAAASAPAAGEG